MPLQVSAFRKRFTVLVMLALSMNCGCRWRLSRAQARQRLAGGYALAVGDCGSHGTRSSTLVLRPDGTYDLHVELTSGEVVDQVGQTWSYDGRVHLANFRINATGDLQKYGSDAAHNVELSRPVVILLGSSPNCFYTQPK